MNNEKLLDAIGGIDDTLVYNAVHDNLKKKKLVPLKWIAIAACLCLVVSGDCCTKLNIGTR